MSDITHEILMSLGQVIGKLDALQTSFAEISTKIVAHDNRLTSVENEIATIKADRAAHMPEWSRVKDQVADLKTALSNAKFLWFGLTVVGGVGAWLIEKFHLLG